MTLTIEEIKSRFGYYFHPPSYAHSPGHPALDVFIRPQPTRRHYDPENFELRVQEPDPHWQYRISELSLFHPWKGKAEHVVAPGRIVISDRMEKKIEAFTFGGRLQVTYQEGLTHCKLNSTAPILEKIEMSSVSALLATEVEVMLAELRGKSIGHLQIYESRLASVDPWELYRSALIALRARLAGFEDRDLDPCATLGQFIDAEIQELKRIGIWGRRPRRFDALLLPPTSLRQASLDD